MNLLAVDIGNTNITCGFFSATRLREDRSNYGSGHLIKRFSIPTADKSRYLKSLRTNLTPDIDGVIICSVVPQSTRPFEQVIKRIASVKPKVLGRDINVPIKNLYSKPRQVGQDRLVNAYAAAELYGCPAIVVDFGTAITFDIVSRNKEYLGGLILPGLNISLDALYARTALLPQVKLAKPKGLIGKDTRSSMLSGIVYGFAALTDNLIERIKRKIGKNVKVIGTGGDISLIRPYCKKIQIIDKNLTLKGLSLIYCNNPLYGLNEC